MLPDDGRVVSNFIIQSLKNEPLTLFGSGEQTRAFCYVDDLVGGLLKLMHTEDSVTGPMNLGNPVEISVKELAFKIKEIIGSRSEIIYKDLPVDDPARRCPDISYAKKTLGWEPVTGLDEGLEKTVKYFDELLRNY